MKLRIAGAQIPVVEDVAANLAALGSALEFAAAEKADVLLTPEGSLSGYTHEFDKDKVTRGLEDVTASARAAGVASGRVSRRRTGSVITKFASTGGTGHFKVFTRRRSGAGRLRGRRAARLRTSPTRRCASFTSTVCPWAG